LEGNYEAEMKFNMIQRFLKFINFDNRVRLEWVSASEGNRFAEVVTEFTRKIKDLGPSPVSEESPDSMIRDKLNAILLAIGSYRMRALVGRERMITEFENVYGEKVSLEKFDDILDKAVCDEYLRHRILISLSNDPKSVKDLAIELKTDSSVILENILVLKSRSQIIMEKIVGISPIYANIMEG
jgi:hypothetical protein